jgi:hypothetical protein
MYGATDQLRRDGDYHPLQRVQRTGAKVDPRVFIAMGSVRLWAGDEPRLFSRLLKRADLSIDTKSISALVWAAWATLSPASLRAFLKLLLGLRNRASSSVQIDDCAVRWQPYKRDALPEEMAPEPTPVLSSRRSRASASASTE